jgi:hypothetical protein
MYTSLSLFLIACLTLSRLPVSLARQQNAFRHEAIDASRKRSAQQKAREPLFMNFTVTEQCPTPISTRPPILSILFPSPDAEPVEITAQSQVVKSFIPEMTWCVGPPIGLIPITTGAPYGNHSMQYATTVAGTGGCETVYAPTETTVCVTTLTGLASKVAITECDQEVTFSSECGFTLETPTLTMNNLSLITPAPTVKRMMTYWMAPWQSLTRGDTPSDVDIKICTEQENGKSECMRYQEVWEVVVVTQTVTKQRQINLETTITGPGTLIVETLHVFITDTIETVDLSTIMLLETEIETETTSKGKKLVTISADGEGPAASTVYITKKVMYRSTMYVHSQEALEIR